MVSNIENEVDKLITPCNRENAALWCKVHESMMRRKQCNYYEDMLEFAETIAEWARSQAE
jgi:dsDNA-binding SOS-regulon protein